MKELTESQNTSQAQRAPLPIISIYCLFSFAPKAAQATPQKTLKQYIHGILQVASKSIGQTNRTMMVIANDATITYLGTAESANQVANAIIQGVLEDNQSGAGAVSVAVGVHIEPVAVVQGFKKHPNYVVNGIHAAKLLASQAQANEIRTSPFAEQSIKPVAPLMETVIQPEIAAEMTPMIQQEHEAEIQQEIQPIIPLDATPTLPLLIEPAPQLDTPPILHDASVKHEHHVLHYQVYLAHLNVALAIDQQRTSAELPLPTQPQQAELNRLNFAAWRQLFSAWNVALTSLMVLMLLTLYVLIIHKPSQLSQVKASPAAAQVYSAPTQARSVAQPSALKPATTTDNLAADMSTPLAEAAQPAVTPVAKTAPAKKKVTAKKTRVARDESAKPARRPGLTWESFKKSLQQGHKSECTQVEAAMNQCD